jgi:palmitoyltransferase
VYVNPYNFGRGKNWRLFLGMARGRTWRHVLLPSTHAPIGEGLTWHTVHSDVEDDSDEEVEDEDGSKREYIKEP